MIFTSVKNKIFHLPELFCISSTTLKSPPDVVSAKIDIVMSMPTLAARLFREAPQPLTVTLASQDEFLTQSKLVSLALKAV